MRSEVLWELAVRRMERAIRPSDWMCMLGGNRFAVSFGNGGHRVPASVLGSRLARALGDHLSVGPDGLDVRVSVAVAAGPSDVTPAELTAASLAALRSARERLAADESARAMVTVVHVPATNLGGAVDEAAGDQHGDTVSTHKLSRRVLVPLSAPVEADPATTMRQATGTVPRVLIVGSGIVDDGQPSLAVEAVAAMARRAGARATIAPSSDPDRVVLDLYVAEPHVVVVVLEGKACHSRSETGNRRPWERPARLVRALRNANAEVVAVGVGATAAEVAACVEQGAVGVLDTNELAHEIATWATVSGNGNGSAGNGSSSVEQYSRRFPAPFAALVGLTPSERRVLFHMMEGLAAADIAEALVVSLPTVRSHIRSILRKLNVNSQLAAVAIANGAVPDHLVSA